MKKTNAKKQQQPCSQTTHEFCTISLTKCRTNTLLSLPGLCLSDLRAKQPPLWRRRPARPPYTGHDSHVSLVVPTAFIWSHTHHTGHLGCRWEVAYTKCNGPSPFFSRRSSVFVFREGVVRVRRTTFTQPSFPLTPPYSLHGLHPHPQETQQVLAGSSHRPVKASGRVPGSQRRRPTPGAKRLIPAFSLIALRVHAHWHR